MGEVAQALRGMLRSPGYAAAAVLTLALGIGISTAMFGIVEASMLRPLPYEETDRLLRFRDHHVPTGGSGGVTTATFMELRAGVRGAQSMAAFTYVSFNVAVGEVPQRAAGLTVTSDFFETLGSPPGRGRGFLPGEDLAGREDVAVITQRMWQDQFGGAADVLGSTLFLDARPHTIVGVLPERFWFPGEPQVIVPFAFTPEQLQVAGNRWLEGLVRLAPGVTAEGLDGELKSAFARIHEEAGIETDWTVRSWAFREWALGTTGSSLLLLTGAVLLVLLIGSVNVANLMLVRAERRARETAVRAALGASRARIARQYIGEGLLLALIGAAAGLGVAWGVTRVLLALYGGNIPRASEFTLSAPVLGGAALLAVTVGVLVGLVPVLRLDMRDPLGTLRGGGRGASQAGTRLQRALVVAQVAIAVLVVSGAALLLHSFARLTTIEPGVRLDDALVFSVQLPTAAYPTRDDTGRFFLEAVQRIERLPMVENVGITALAPLQGGLNVTALASPADAERTASFVELREVTPGFFPAAGIPLRAGRLLETADVEQAREVVVISDELARALFPDGDAIGHRLFASDERAGLEIVGIVGSVREFGIMNEPRPAVYAPFTQTVLGQRSSMVFIVHTVGAPMAAMPAIRQQIRELDSTLPLFAVSTMRDVMIGTTGARWLATNLFTAFALLALALAGLGIFAVLAYIVEQRTREIGIRVALGATIGDVRRLVVTRGLRVVGLGLLIGIAGAVLLSGVLADLLYEVQPGDPLTLAGVAAVALACGALAAWLPARRAAQIEPMIAIRSE